MTATSERPQWRGWDETSSGRVGLVTSSRLGNDAPVQNRAFPKVRSWFALGAPLELLSPLSVLRIVAILIVAGTLLVIRGTPSAHRVGLVAVITLGIGLLMGLSRVKELGRRHCVVLAGVAILIIDLLVAAGGGAASGTLGVMLFIPVAIFVGMFIPWRALLGLQCFLSGSVAAAFVIGGSPPGEAALLAVLTGVGTTCAAITVALTAASARHTGMIDADTGLPNGYGFADALGRELAGSTVVVAAVDLGGLESAREALGHRAGTELLRRAVEDLGQILPSGATIGRVDGDRLAVFRATSGSLDPAAHEVAAIALADHLADGIGAGRYLVDEIEVILRPHIGIALGPTDGSDPTELIRRATLGAIRARTSGRVSARWSPEMTGAMTGADLALLADLRLASERGELQMAYQPQIDPSTDATVAVEALLRWSSPTHGSVPPDRFIALAERTGLIDRLTDWVIAETLDAQVRWRRVGLTLPVSVNVSAGSLSDPELPGRVLGALRDRRLPGEILTVEVTETAALDAEQALGRLGALHDAGVGISIDDFGTGYTSLAVLPQLPVDELKVDQRFVIASATSPADDTIVRSVLGLAHQLGMRAVAEGVEDHETAQRLRDYGFDLLQGWAFSKALPEAELMSFVCAAPHAAASMSRDRLARSGGAHDSSHDAAHEVEAGQPG